MSMLAAALDLVDVAGVAVFPTGPTCKPGTIEKFGALLDGVTEPNERWFRTLDGVRDHSLIRSIWTRYPKANVSVATGEASGCFVLDVDTKDGFDGRADLEHLELLYDILPTTWRSRTPSGGEHIWFRQPDRPLTNRVHFRIPDGQGGEKKSGLDVRTTGGAAAAPPSRKASGAYVWLTGPGDADLAHAPHWLLELIDPPLPPCKPFEPVHVASLDRTARYVEAAVNGECGDLARMAQGSGRNLKLFMASANLGQLVGAKLLAEATAEGALIAAAGDCGLVKEDGLRAVRATIASGMKKGLASPREVRR